MLVYQAFPLVGATPEVHMHLMLLNFREMARGPQRSTFVAYSEFLSSQFAFQVGQRPLCIRPHSLYATRLAKYDPDRNNPRVLVSRVAGWARDGGVALVHLVEMFANRDLRPQTQLRFVFLGLSREPSDTVGGVDQPFGYAELRRFRAAVYFPWDMGMLLFSELYNMGVPLLIPSRTWIAAIIKRMLEYLDFGWWQVRSNSAVVLPASRRTSSYRPAQEDGNSTNEHFAHVNATMSTGDPMITKEIEDVNAFGMWPWLSTNSTIAEIIELYDRTDFVRWPHVKTFDSLPALMSNVRSLDFDSTSEAMQRWNEAELPRSLDILNRAVGAMLGVGGEPSVVGESSCA